MCQRLFWGSAWRAATGAAQATLRACAPLPCLFSYYSTTATHLLLGGRNALHHPPGGGVSPSLAIRTIN